MRHYRRSKNAVNGQKIIAPGLPEAQLLTFAGYDCYYLRVMGWQKLKPQDKNEVENLFESYGILPEKSKCYPSIALYPCILDTISAPQ